MINVVLCMTPSSAFEADRPIQRSYCEYFGVAHTQLLSTVYNPVCFVVGVQLLKLGLYVVQ